MNQEYKDILETFAESIISKDYDIAYRLFSSGLKDSISQDELQKVMEKHFIELNQEWETKDELEYPKDFSISEGVVDYDYFVNEKNNYSLFRSSKKIPNDITKENYLIWAHIAFLVSEEQSEYLDFDGWFDFWCILIKKDNEIQIGYFEIHELD
ncbi:MAG: hypothetical protein U0354_12475 [Candidatus Sericytochromatia bacterium]